MNKITVEETKALCEKYGVLLLAYHADRFERLGALIDDLRATQPPQDERYVHEYTKLPHPGDFGVPKGHWWQAKQYHDAMLAAESAQPVALSTLTDEQILAGVKEFADENYYANYKDDILRCVRTLLAASAPAQQATPRPVAAEVPPGMALVPIEPTPAMIEAGERADGDNITAESEYAAIQIYQAMLAASQDSAKETK